MSETVGTIARVLSVLRAIAEAEGAVGVKDISSSLGLPMSTSHRLLELLRDAGFVEKEAASRRYAVGAEFFRIANLVTHKTSLSSQVQPLLDELTRETRETALFVAYLAARHTMTYAAKSESPHSLRFQVELFRQTGLEWGSAGLAILAFLPDEVQTAVFRNAQPSSTTGRRLTRGEFLTRIATVRRDGFAMTESEKVLDSVGIAAPLEAAPGVVVGAIMLTIPKIRFVRAQTKVYVDLVRRAAARFSSGIAKPDVRRLRPARRRVS